MDSLTLSPTHRRLLVKLARSKRPLRPSELTSEVGGRAADYLRDLERQGLVVATYSVAPDVGVGESGDVWRVMDLESA